MMVTVAISPAVMFPMLQVTIEFCGVGQAPPGEAVAETNVASPPEPRKSLNTTPLI